MAIYDLRLTIGFEILRRLNITAKHSGIVVDYLNRVGAVEVSWCSEPAKDFQLNVAIVRDDAGQLVFGEESKNSYPAVFSALLNNLLISCFNGAWI